LQKSASIQPRTSLSKLGGKFNSIFIRLPKADPAAEAALLLEPLWTLLQKEATKEIRAKGADVFVNLGAQSCVQIQEFGLVAEFLDDVGIVKKIPRKLAENYFSRLAST
jgi:hypothetical protein